MDGKLIDDLCERCFCDSVDVMRLKAKDALRESMSHLEILDNLSQLGKIEIAYNSYDVGRIYRQTLINLRFIPFEEGEEVTIKGASGLPMLLSIFKQMVCDKIKIKRDSDKMT